jgi:hypothetical protein
MASAFTLAAVFDVIALLIVVVIIRDRAPQAD